MRGMQLPSLTDKDENDELRLDAVTSSQLDLLTSYGYEYFPLMYNYRKLPVCIHPSANLTNY